MGSIMMYYSRLAVILACIAASGSLYALTAPDDKAAATDRDTDAQEQKPDPSAKQNPRKAKKPATTFNPSERIGADSAVSFPVDI
ncbi:MAG: hypothetical protein WBO34_12260 [Gammaproteobacteria bacterium]